MGTCMQFSPVRKSLSCCCSPSKLHASPDWAPLPETACRGRKGVSATKPRPVYSHPITSECIAWAWPIDQLNPRGGIRSCLSKWIAPRPIRATLAKQQRAYILLWNVFFCSALKEKPKPHSFKVYSNDSYSLASVDGHVVISLSPQWLSTKTERCDWSYPCLVRPYGSWLD